MVHAKRGSLPDACVSVSQSRAGVGGWVVRPWGCVAPHFQAAAAAAAPADVFLKTNKKIGNAQRAKGGTKNNITIVDQRGQTMEVLRRLTWRNPCGV